MVAAGVFFFFFYIVLYCSVKQHNSSQPPLSTRPLFPPEMCCRCNRPAGGDGASRGCREGLRGGVLDAAAENRVQDAPWEDPQRPHAPGALQTGENIQVNLQGFFYSWGRKKKKKENAWRLLYPFHFCFFSWDLDADKFIALLRSFSYFPDISNSPNYWVGTLTSHCTTNPGSPMVNDTSSNRSKKK